MNIFSKLNQEMDIPAERHTLKWWHWILLVLLVVGTGYITIENNQKPQTYKTCEGFIFGTQYHITYKSDSDLQKDIEDILNQVDNSLSPFNKNSVITAINNNQDIAVNDMFKEVFLTAKEISANTGGAFDITVAPLVNAWGFGFKNKENVTDSLIAEILTHVGFEKVILNDNHIVKTDTATMLDCSAIAKGYGVDAVGHFLESRSIKNYMVEIGGEVRLRGVNPKSKKWSIGISTPQPDELGETQDYQEILQTTDICMATSGNYRNFYQEGEKRYAHTINPHTGYPAQQDILSATVLTNSCMVADAYATSFMVLGLEGSKEILKKHPELKAYFICSDEEGKNFVWYSESLKDNFRR